MNKSTHYTNLARTTPRVLAILLKDQTLSSEECTRNIFWASDGPTHNYFDIISIEHFRSNGAISVTSRVCKEKSLQISRSKKRGEVFTPAWICNAQNNLVDEQWFGRTPCFNIEVANDDGTHSWNTINDKIVFPPGLDWTQYVKSKRMEIACGEAPYLTSRYDVTTGVQIGINDRVGILDRKFRIINENIPCLPTASNKRKWLRRAYQALQATYGFDWQGDNVFLARESVFCTFCDNFYERWQKVPNISIMEKVAEIISWNIWQMDGTTYTIPHTDVPCLVMNWKSTGPLEGEAIVFKQLIKK